MKKKGFTLVELLAVIVILSVIALITVPMILNVIENSRREATKITGNNYINYLEEHIAMEKLKDNPIIDGEYEVIQDGKKLQKKEQTRSVTIIEMNLKGKLPTSGSIIIKNGRVEEAELHIGKYTYTYKIDENGKSLVSITKEGQIAPENVSLSLNSKVSSITATITCPDTKGSKAKTYKYKLNDKSWIEKNTNIHEFVKLKEKTEYKVTAQCINDTGGMTEVSGKTTTKELETPTFEIKPGSEEEWASERTVTITYPTGEGLKYSYSLDKGTTWIDTEDKETKVKFKENGNIIAKVSGEDEEGNEINVKITSTYTVDGIDVTGPSDHKPSGVATTKSITVTSNQKDEESKIQKVEYAIYEDNKWSEWQSSDTFNGLKNGETYKIKTKATNKVGIFTESKEESVQTQDIPVPTYSESGSGNKKTVKITFAAGFTNSYSKDGGKTWKTANKNPEEVEFDDNGTLVAKSSDGKNEVTSTYIVDGIVKITTAKPTAQWKYNGTAMFVITQNQGATGTAYNSMEYYYKKSSDSNWTKTSSTIQNITQGIYYDFKTKTENIESEVLTMMVPFYVVYTNDNSITPKLPSINITLKSPTRSGYNFLRFEDSAGNKYNAGQTYSANANLILTAKWRPTSQLSVSKRSATVYMRSGGTDSIAITGNSGNLKIDFNTIGDGYGGFTLTILDGSKTLYTKKYDRYDDGSHSITVPGFSGTGTIQVSRSAFTGANYPDMQNTFTLNKITASYDENIIYWEP